MRISRSSFPISVAFVLWAAVSFAQGKSIDATARRQIDAGNQMWVDGMKQGNVQLLIDGYTQDAVDCDAAGVCIRGRAALESHARDGVAKLGKADSASVTSVGSVQRGQFVYEWGQAEAHFPSGKKIVDRYLTVWREEPKGTWKVFRNLVMPEK